MYLAKCVGCLDHARDLLKGRVYMNNPAYFRDLEERQAEKAGRADSNEGSYIYQGRHLSRMVISVNGQDRVIPPSDIVKVSTHANVLDAWRVFSVFAGYPRPGDPKVVTDESLARITTFPAQRLSCEFGDYTVLIHNIQPFLDRVQAYCVDSGYGLRTGFVTYIDPDRDSVTPARDNPLKPIFHKYDIFAYQQEIRIAVLPTHEQESPLILDIGDISDIAAVVETGSIRVNASVDNDTLNVRIRTGPLLSPLQDNGT